MALAPEPRDQQRAPCGIGWARVEPREQRALNFLGQRQAAFAAALAETCSQGVALLARIPGQVSQAQAAQFLGAQAELAKADDDRQVTRRTGADARPAGVSSSTRAAARSLTRCHVASSSDGRWRGRPLTVIASVRTHVKPILMKLDLRDRVQAVMFAYETGINRPADGG